MSTLNSADSIADPDGHALLTTGDRGQVKPDDLAAQTSAEIRTERAARQARHAALAAEDAAELERFAAAHPPTPLGLFRAGLVHARRTAEDVLEAFGRGRSAELAPNSGRDTLTSKAIRAGWGGR